MKDKKAAWIKRHILPVMAVFVLAVTGCTKTDDTPDPGGGRTRRGTETKKEAHGPLTGFYYSPGYGDMSGEYHAERITQNENGDYVYEVTDRESFDAPEVTTVYAFDEAGLATLKEIIDRYDICAFETRRKTDRDVTDYSPWSYSLTFDDSAYGGSAYETVSFGEFRKYREKDHEAMDELLETARSLRGEQIDVVTTGGGDDTDDTDDTETQTESDMNLAVALYDEVIAETHEYIVNGHEEGREYRYLSTGLMEAVNHMTLDKALRTIGYCITDISGDFVPELLIGLIPEEGDSAAGADLYSCFSVRNGELVPVFEAWYRNRMRWLSGNSFFHNGSSGAASSVFGILRFEGETPDDHLSGHEIETVWEEFFFTKENGAGGVSSYHNRTGEEDPASSELLDDDQAAFWEIYESYDAYCRPLPMKPVASRRDEQQILKGTADLSIPVTGYWFALTHTNRVIIGYYFHPDGTWTTDANLYGYLNPHEFSEQVGPTAFFGTWEATDTGPDGTPRYLMYGSDGTELRQIQILPPTGETDAPNGDTPTMEFSDGFVFYKSRSGASGEEALTEDCLYGEWMAPDGAMIEVYDYDGTLAYAYYPAPGYRMTYGTLQKREAEADAIVFDASNDRGGVSFVFRFGYGADGTLELRWDDTVFHMGVG